MQLVGLSPFLPALERIASRSPRMGVYEWAARVVPRHVRRTRSLHALASGETEVRKAAAADGLAPEVVDRIVASFRGGGEIHVPSPAAMDAFVASALDVMDYMESLDTSDRHIRRIERLSWADAEALSREWHASLARVDAAREEVSSGEVRASLFPDGYYMAELVSEAALKTEGARMQHCVGGYWTRVKRGGTRIVSLRDPEGKPHVTVELGRVEEFDVEGLGQVKLMERLRPGVNVVLPSEVEWYAVQIRGKQNRPPIPKYALKVDRWLRASGIPSSESRRTPPEEGSVVLFSVTDGTRSVVTTDAIGAFRRASEHVVRLVENGTTPGAAARDTGILDIADHVSDRCAVEDFVSAVSGAFRERMEKLHAEGGRNLLRILAGAGIDRIARRCASTSDPHRDLLVFLAEKDSAAEAKLGRVTVAAVPGGESLFADVTTVPALGLSMVSAVDPATRERILDALEPKLRAFVKNIRSQPGRYHVLVPTVSTVRDGDLVQAIFACGLGEEYAAAASISRSEVRALVRRMATQSRKARGAGEAANLGANMLADGYETRIPRHLATRCGGSPLVVGPEAPRALRPVISPQSPVKSYSLPVSPAPRRPR